MSRHIAETGPAVVVTTQPSAPVHVSGAGRGWGRAPRDQDHRPVRLSDRPRHGGAPSPNAWKVQRLRLVIVHRISDLDLGPFGRSLERLEPVVRRLLDRRGEAAQFLQRPEGRTVPAGYPRFHGVRSDVVEDRGFADRQAAQLAQQCVRGHRTASNWASRSGVRPAARTIASDALSMNAAKSSSVMARTLRGVARHISAARAAQRAGSKSPISAPRSPAAFKAPHASLAASSTASAADRLSRSATSAMMSSNVMVAPSLPQQVVDLERRLAARQDDTGIGDVFRTVFPCVQDQARQKPALLLRRRCPVHRIGAGGATVQVGGEALTGCELVLGHLKGSSLSPRAIPSTHRHHTPLVYGDQSRSVTREAKTEPKP